MSRCIARSPAVLTLTLALVALSALACSRRAEAPAPITTKAPAVEHQRVPKVHEPRVFFETTSLWGASFSADETRILVTSDATGISNAWSQPVAGGAPTQLTTSTTDSVSSVSYFPADDRILFSHDQGGNELDHLYVRELDGTERDLTPGESLKAAFAGWSGDLESFLVLTNERDEKYFDLCRYQASGYARTLVFRNDGGFQFKDMSPDGRWVALQVIRTNADASVFLWDSSKPKAAPVEITPHEGTVSNDAATFSADSASLYFLSDAQSEFLRLWSHDLATGKQQVVHEAPWDVQVAGVSRDGRWMLVGVNEDARSVATVLDLRAGAPVPLTGLPAGSVAGPAFSKSGNLLALHVTSSTSPSNLFVVDLPAGTARRLTDTLNPAVDEDDLVPATVVRFPSFDGKEIPALLYRPHVASASRRLPALVSVHGGPGGQSTIDYSATTQVLLNHGYAVLEINNRGSSGYGKTFFHLDDLRHGEDDLQDCVFARKYLSTLDWVDPQRVGIMGGSYGGYMVLAALSLQPDAFDVGVDYFGISNWVRTLESIPPWWEDYRESLVAELGDPVQDRERLTRISPLFNADKIRKPLLVVQGANDPRVLKVESDDIVAAVRKNGVPVEYVVFDDEGHGFSKRVNNVAAAEALLRFLDAHLARMPASP